MIFQSETTWLNRKGLVERSCFFVLTKCVGFFFIVFLTSYFMLHTVPHYTETTPDNSWLCCIIILALSWSSLALFDGLLHWCQGLAFYSAPSARVWISQPGSYSKAQMTAILTRNDAFVPDSGLELVSKPHILPLFSHQRHFYQAGIKQNTRAITLSHGLLSHGPQRQNGQE